MRKRTQTARAAPSGPAQGPPSGSDVARDGQHEWRAAESGADDAGHGLGDPSEDDAVHQQAEIDGAEAAQECGGASAVTQLGKLHVGEKSAAAPEAREEKDGHHAAESSEAHQSQLPLMPWV